MTTLDEALPNMVTVIKTEPETEGEFLEDAETDDAFEQIFIKEEGNEDGMEFQATDVASGVDGLKGTQMDGAEPDGIPGSSMPIQQNVQGFHLNLHNELPLLGGIKKEPAEETSCPAMFDVAEKMRSRFLQILRKQPKAEMGTRDRSSDGPGYILPDDNISEDEDGSTKYGINKLPGSSTTANILNLIQLNKEARAEKHICDICNGPFNKLSEMERHKLTHNPDQLLIHVCKICGRRFAKWSNLWRHEHSHSRAPAICEDCGRKFRFHCELKKHQKRSRHKKSKRFTKCELWKRIRESESI